MVIYPELSSFVRSEFIINVQNVFNLNQCGMDASDHRLWQPFKAPGPITNRLTDVKNDLLTAAAAAEVCLHFELQLPRFLSVPTFTYLKDLGRTKGNCTPEHFFLRPKFPTCFRVGWNSLLKFFQVLHIHSVYSTYLHIKTKFHICIYITNYLHFFTMFLSV